MTIISLQQRFNNSTIGIQTLNELREIQKKQNSTFDWSGRTHLTQNCFINLNNVMIDEESQRPPFGSARIRKLKHIVKNPCSFQFKRIILSKRQCGALVVVEGQGRALVAYAMGIQEVPCEIYEFKSKADEIKFFKNQQQSVHSVTGWDKHHVIQGCPQDKDYNQSIDLEKIVDACDLNYDPSINIGHDAQTIYGGLKDCMIKFEPTSAKNGLKKSIAGQRNCFVPIEITKLMIKYSGQSQAKLNGNLYYPFAEFVMQRSGKNKNFKKALKELDSHLASLQKTLNNLPIPQPISLSIIFEQLGLNNLMNNKRATTWKIIRTW